MSELRQVLDRLGELADQNALMLANQDVMQLEVRNALSRLAHVEERVAKLESEPPAMFRAPQPSLTSEERHRTLDSIRAAVEHQTEKQTPLFEATARASKLTPYALAAGLIVSAFVSGLIQNCHIGGASWGTSSNSSSAPSGSSSPH